MSSMFQMIDCSEWQTLIQDPNLRIQNIFNKLDSINSLHFFKEALKNSGQKMILEDILLQHNAAWLFNDTTQNTSTSSYSSSSSPLAPSLPTTNDRDLIFLNSLALEFSPLISSSDLERMKTWLGPAIGGQWPDRKSTRPNSSHIPLSRMPASA